METSRMVATPWPVARCPLPSPATMDDWAVLFLEHCAVAQAWGFHLVNFGYFFQSAPTFPFATQFRFILLSNLRPIDRHLRLSGWQEDCGGAEVRLSARYQQRLDLLPPSLTIGYLAFIWRANESGYVRQFGAGILPELGRACEAPLLLPNKWNLITV